MTQTDDPVFPETMSDVPGNAASSTPDPTSGHDIPPRIELDACLQTGRGDSARLLISWFIKKSFWWMFFGGAALASAVHFTERVDNEFQVNYRSPESIGHGLLSAWALVVLAVIIRVLIGWVAAALAYPLARRHEFDLPLRTGWNRHYATLSDRYKVAKAFRALRWTHHVRQLALDRVSPGPGWWRRWDPILDVVNVVGVLAFVLVNVTIATVGVTDLTT